MNERGAFSVSEFCDWAGIGRTKVYEEIEAQRLPVVKVGKRTLIRLYDAKAWLQSLPSPPPPPTAESRAAS
jgi:excisionase family DNA binding protein